MSFDIYELRLQPYFVMSSGQTFTCGDIPSSITVNPWKKTYRGRHKYGIDFYNISDTIKNNIKYVVLHVKKVDNLTAKDFKIINGSIIIKNKIKLSHEDILKSYTIPVINKTDIVIGNLTANFISNGDGTWNITFDPTITTFGTSTGGIPVINKTSDIEDNPPPTNLELSFVMNDAVPTNYDSSDGTRSAINVKKNSPDEGFFMFGHNITTIDTNEIITVNWTIDVSNSGSGNDIDVTYYMYNYSNTEWWECTPGETFSGVTSQHLRYCDSSDIDDFVNDTDDFTFFLWYITNSDNSNNNALVDYIALEITHDGIIINSPVNTITQNLSVTLNTSQATYNETLWYTITDGIINNTLCTSANECEGILVFPRTGTYNLTVYGNRSDGEESSVSLNNIQATQSCFQESTNVSTGCGGLSTGVYGNFEQFIFMNYSTLSEFETAPQWQIKHGELDTYESAINEICWTNTSDTLILRAYAFMPSGTGSTSYGQCYNGTGWVTTTEIEVNSDSVFSVNAQSVSAAYDEDYSTHVFWGETNSRYESCNSGKCLDSRWFEEGLTWINDSVDSAPVVNLVTVNHSNFSISTSINLTYNYTDDNLYVLNISFFINNVLNQSRGQQTDLDTNLNFTIDSIAEGTHTWFVSVIDTDSNTTNSTINTFTIDTTGPNVTIKTPKESEEFSNNESITLNFSVVDTGVGVDTCWFNVDSGDNTTITSCVNTTFNTTGEGTLTLNLYANDTLGNEALDSNTFTITLTAPAITLDSPLNATFFNSNLDIYINYTVTDTSGIDTVQIWHDFTGSFSLNETNLGVTSGLQNFSLFNVSDGIHMWTIFANDTGGNGRFSTNNFTFTTDTIFPNITIGVITTPSGSQTITFDVNSSDINLDTCKYSIFNSTSEIDGLNENVSITCNTLDQSATVSAFATYNLTFYSVDLAGNENSTTKGFTVSQVVVDGGGGGGGSGEIVIIVVGINLTWSLSTDTRSDKFDLIMIAGGKRERKLIFTNLADQGVNINIRCDDITGELCKYVTFDNPNENASLIEETFLTQMTLLGTVNEERVLDFIIQLPENLPDGIYDFNIIAIDQEGNPASVSVRVRVGTFGFFSLLISKTLGKTQFEFLRAISDTLADLKVQNIILFVIPIIVVAPLLLVFLPDVRIKPFVSILAPMMMIILLFIFLDA